MAPDLYGLDSPAFSVPLRVNWNHPLTKRLMFCIVPIPGGAVELVANQVFHYQNGGVTKFGKGRYACIYDGTNGDLFPAQELSIRGFTMASDEEVACFAITRKKTPVSANLASFSFDPTAGSGGAGLSLQWGWNTTRANFIWGTHNAIQLSATDAIGAGLWGRIGFSGRYTNSINQTDMYGYLNGKPNGNRTTTGDINVSNCNYNQVYLGRSASYQAESETALLMAWHRFMSSAEHMMLAKDPYCFLEPAIGGL